MAARAAGPDDRVVVVSCCRGERVIVLASMRDSWRHRCGAAGAGHVIVSLQDLMPGVWR